MIEYEVDWNVMTGNQLVARGTEVVVAAKAVVDDHRVRMTAMRAVQAMIQPYVRGMAGSMATSIYPLYEGRRIDLPLEKFEAAVGHLEATGSSHEQAATIAFGLYAAPPRPPEFPNPEES